MLLAVVASLILCTLFALWLRHSLFPRGTRKIAASSPAPLAARSGDALADVAAAASLKDLPAASTAPLSRAASGSNPIPSAALAVRASQPERKRPESVPVEDRVAPVQMPLPLPKRPASDSMQSFSSRMSLGEDDDDDDAIPPQQTVPLSKFVLADREKCSCGAMVPTHLMDDHVENVCPRAQRACLVGCGERLERQRMAEHLLRCPAYALPCPRCLLLVRRSDYSSHFYSHLVEEDVRASHRHPLAAFLDVPALVAAGTELVPPQSLALAAPSITQSAGFLSELGVCARCGERVVGHQTSSEPAAEQPPGACFADFSDGLFASVSAEQRKESKRDGKESQSEEGRKESKLVLARYDTFPVPDASPVVARGKSRGEVKDLSFLQRVRGDKHYEVKFSHGCWHAGAATAESKGASAAAAASVSISAGADTGAGDAGAAASPPLHPRHPPYFAPLSAPQFLSASLRLVQGWADLFEKAREERARHAQYESFNEDLIEQLVLGGATFEEAEAEAEAPLSLPADPEEADTEAGGGSSKAGSSAGRRGGGGGRTATEFKRDARNNLVPVPVRRRRGGLLVRCVVQPLREPVVAFVAAVHAREALPQIEAAVGLPALARLVVSFLSPAAAAAAVKRAAAAATSSASFAGAAASSVSGEIKAGSRGPASNLSLDSEPQLPPAPPPMLVAGPGPGLGLGLALDAPSQRTRSSRRKHALLQ